MTAVTIRGTFKKDSRPDNGLEDVADEMLNDRNKVFRVVGLMKYAGASISEDGQITPGSRFLSIEVVAAEDEDAHERMIDKRRKQRGLASAKEEFAKRVDPTLFDMDEEDDDEPVRNASGEPVPPPSKAELDAEKAETAEQSAAIVDANLRANGSEGLASVPAAEFSGKADG